MITFDRRAVWVSKDYIIMTNACVIKQQQDSYPLSSTILHVMAFLYMTYLGGLIEMNLVGFSVLIIAIAFAVLVIFLIRTLTHLNSVLHGVNETVEKLPDQLDEMMKETGAVIHQSNDTLADVNEKLRALSPLFYIIGDAGEASRKLSSSLVDLTMSMKKSTEEGKESVQKRDLGGIYGALSLAYFLYQKRKTLKDLKQGKETA